MTVRNKRGLRVLDGVFTRTEQAFVNEKEQVTVRPTRTKRRRSVGYRTHYVPNPILREALERNGY